MHLHRGTWLAHAAPKLLLNADANVEGSITDCRRLGCDQEVACTGGGDWRWGSIAAGGNCTTAGGAQCASGPGRDDRSSAWHAFTGVDVRRCQTAWGAVDVYVLRGNRKMILWLPELPAWVRVQRLTLDAVGCRQIGCRRVSHTGCAVGYLYECCDRPGFAAGRKLPVCSIVKCDMAAQLTQMFATQRHDTCNDKYNA